MSAISTALTGIQASSARLENAANNIANLNTPKFRAQQPDQIDTSAGVQVTFSPTSAPANPETSNVDLVSQSIELITAQTSVKANVAVLHAQDAIQGSLLDILA